MAKGTECGDGGTLSLFLTIRSDLRILPGFSNGDGEVVATCTRFFFSLNIFEWSAPDLCFNNYRTQGSEFS